MIRCRELRNPHALSHQKLLAIFSEEVLTLVTQTSIIVRLLLSNQYSESCNAIILPRKKFYTKVLTKFRVSQSIILDFFYLIYQEFWIKVLEFWSCLTKRQQTKRTRTHWSWFTKWERLWMPCTVKPRNFNDAVIIYII